MQVTKMTRLIVAIIWVLVLLLLNACTRRAVNGYFVADTTANQVMMIHIVEAPRGHLSGALVLSTLAPSGSQLDVSNYGTTGSIAGNNVSLTITGGLATIEGWLGGGNNLVGSLSGDRLTLSKGGETWGFERMTEAAYQSRIGKLASLQAIVVQDREASQGMKEAVAYAKQVSLALQQYLAWGKERIDRQASVSEWYTKRIRSYSECIVRIRPLAEARVPSWRWQGCVLSIETDSYDREQMLSSAQEMVTQEQGRFASLNKMIEQRRTTFAAALQRLHAICPDSAKPKLCESLWEQMNAGAPHYLIVSGDVDAFRSLAPHVKQAVQADLANATGGNAKLNDLAKQAQQILQGAQN